jgi:anthranilate/para-aminobenzoate synthase component I
VHEGGAELWSWGKEPPDAKAWGAFLKADGPGTSAVLGLKPAWDEARHRGAVAHIRERILEGGFYVANLCVPFRGRFMGETTALALTAFDRARPPFGALLDLGELKLLSLSMERLLARRGDRIWSQPIKGSAPLTGDPERDAEAAKAMAADPKERAEHTMILDLVRNDLGRVSRPGSVQVVRPMAVEPYPTVQHLVSTVESFAKPGLGLAELLRALLPGGSVTGAPKHAVCTHLAGAEAAPRGFYCGALGWISANGDLDLALPIRTAQVEGEALTYWAGGGITRRSDPSLEWAELFLKTRAITG